MGFYVCVYEEEEEEENFVEAYDKQVWPVPRVSIIYLSFCNCFRARSFFFLNLLHANESLNF